MVFTYYYFRRAFEICIDMICTYFSWIRMRVWGVTSGKHNRYSGHIAIRKYPESKIIIGSNCRFLSAYHSNQIGMYTRCSLSTLNAKSRIEIGDGCGFSGTVIACANSIIIGKNVRCGANTLIIDTDFHTDDARAGQNKEVVIGNNVWLGYGVKVLKGVHIGEGSLIGAMSVVTKDIPSGVVAAGNPCKIIKNII